MAGPAGDASSVVEGKGYCRAGGDPEPRGALSWGILSRSQALVSVYPDIKFRIVFLRLGSPGRPAAPARAWLLDIEAGAWEGGGSSCTEPISTAPVG